MPNLTNAQKMIIAGVGGFILIVVVFLMFGIGVKPSNPTQTVLYFWGADNPEVFSGYIDAFQKANPNIYIKYSRIEGNYESQLIDALAAGKGPDIMFFRSSWLPKHQNKIVPAPADLMPSGRFDSLYPRVALDDFTRNDQVYALPLYIDTLALYYNKDIFDRAGIAIPPATWEDLQKYAFSKKINTALGGSSGTVRQSVGILDSLFLQAGATIGDKGTINLYNGPGDKALGYYTSFYKPPTEDSRIGFAAGRIGMMFDYHTARAELKNRSPFLNYGVAPLPQFVNGTRVVSADYYGLAVSATSVNSALSWAFINSIATSDDFGNYYIQNTGQPPALRNLIDYYSSDYDLGPFASQALIARSWTKSDDNSIVRFYDTAISALVPINAKAKAAAGKVSQEVTKLQGVINGY